MDPGRIFISLQKSYSNILPQPMYILYFWNFKIFPLFEVNYRPQTKFVKVMFSQVSVCPQGGVSQHALCRVCVCIPACTGWGCITASTGPLGPEVGGVADTPHEDQRQTPPSPVDSTGYGQQAGGTHPTGMRSCSLCKYINLIDIGKFPVFYPVWKNEDSNSLCHGSPEILH